jgi:hypothetical protein
MEIPTRIASVQKITRHSRDKTSTTSSLEGKVLTIKKNSSDPVNMYKRSVVLLHRSCIILMLFGSLSAADVPSVMATGIRCKKLNVRPRMKRW